MTRLAMTREDFRAGLRCSWGLDCGRDAVKLSVYGCGELHIWEKALCRLHYHMWYLTFTGRDGWSCPRCRGRIIEQLAKTIREG